MGLIAVSLRSLFLYFTYTVIVDDTEVLLNQMQARKDSTIKPSSSSS